jgi:uncharacterized protein (DUF58 family)
MPPLFKRLLLRNFRAVFNSSMWVRRRFTPSGRFLLGVLIFAGALGIDTRINIVHQLFALCLVALLLALLWAPLFWGRFRVRRLLPRYATVDQPLEYGLELENLGRRPRRGLHVIDELGIRYPSVEEFFHSHEPGEGRRNWFDRKVGYPRWAWMMWQRAGGLEPEGGLEWLPAGAADRIALRLTPVRRGWIDFRRIHLGRADPLGLFRGRKLLPLRDRLLVLPRRYPIPAVDLPGGQRYQKGGVSLASQVGESEELVGLRDYRAGDPPRKIHWKALAKLGRPIVKEYRDEYFVRHGLVLDTFCGGGGPDFEAAVSVAASFVVRLDSREALLDLLFVGDQVHQVTAGRHLAGSELLLETLACVTPSPVGDFRRLEQALRSRARQLSGCICVLLGWDESRQQLVQRLEGMGTPVLPLVISRDPGAGQTRAARFLHPDHLERDLGCLR